MTGNLPGELKLSLSGFVVFRLMWRTDFTSIQLRLAPVHDQSFTFLSSWSICCTSAAPCSPRSDGRGWTVASRPAAQAASFTQIIIFAEESCLLISRSSSCSVQSRFCFSLKKLKLDFTWLNSINWTCRLDSFGLTFQSQVFISFRICQTVMISSLFPDRLHLDGPVHWSNGICWYRWTISCFWSCCFQESTVRLCSAPRLHLRFWQLLSPQFYTFLFISEKPSASQLQVWLLDPSQIFDCWRSCFRSLIQSDLELQEGDLP